MTPLEIRNLRESFDLSRKEFGRLVYQTERAVRAWETGDRNMPEALQELVQIKLGISDDFRATKGRSTKQ